MGDSAENRIHPRSRRPYVALENEKAQFAEWLATPENIRRPKTMKELSEIMNVSRQTLRVWSTDYRVIGDQRKLVAQRIVEAWPDLIEAATKTAMDPSNPKQIQALKLLADWHEKQLEVDVASTEDMSDAEIKALAIRMYDSVDEDTQVA